MRFARLKKPKMRIANSFTVCDRRRWLRSRIVGGHAATLDQLYGIENTASLVSVAAGYVVLVMRIRQLADVGVVGDHE